MSALRRLWARLARRRDPDWDPLDPFDPFDENLPALLRRQAD